MRARALSAWLVCRVYQFSWRPPRAKTAPTDATPTYMARLLFMHREFSRPADASAIRHEQRVRGCARVVLIEPRLCSPTPDASRPHNTGISCETRFNDDTRAVPFAGARVSLGYTRFVSCIPLLCGAVLRNCCGLQGSAKQRALRNGRCRTLPPCPRAIRPTFRKGPASELRRWCSKHGFGPSPQSHDICDSTTALCARGLERLARLQGLPVRLEAAQSQDGADGRDAHIHGATTLHAP